MTREIATEENLEGAAPAADLLALDGMDDALAQALASKGIITQEDLAEQAVDELIGIGGLEKERASELIMTARAPWFADSEA